MRLYKKIAGSLLFVSFIGAGVYVWHRYKKPSPPKFRTHTPTVRDVVDARVIRGRLMPCKEVDVRTHMSGILEKYYVQPGDVVKPGALIARIQAQPKAIQVEKARTEAQQARIAYATQTQQYERSQKLFDRGLLSAAQHESARQTWQAAQEAEVHARRALDFMKQGFVPGQKKASNQIRATASGTVSALACKEGTVVAEPNLGSPGTCLATLSDTSRVVFESEVDEVNVIHFKEGMPLQVRLSALPQKQFTATLTKIALKATKESFQSRNESARFEVEAVLHLNDAEKDLIRTGYTGIAEVVLQEAKNVLTIEEAWLPHQDNDSKTAEEAARKAWVWVCKDGAKERREVELGISDSIHVEIKKGLDAETQVITEEV